MNAKFSTKSFLFRIFAVFMIAMIALATIPVATTSAAPLYSVAAIEVGGQLGSLTYGTAGSATFLVTLTSGSGGTGDIPSTTFLFPICLRV